MSGEVASQIGKVTVGTEKDLRAAFAVWPMLLIHSLIAVSVLFLNISGRTDPRFDGLDYTLLLVALFLLGLQIATALIQGITDSLLNLMKLSFLCVFFAVSYLTVGRTIYTHPTWALENTSTWAISALVVGCVAVFIGCRRQVKTLFVFI